MQFVKTMRAAFLISIMLIADNVIAERPLVNAIEKEGIQLNESEKHKIIHSLGPMRIAELVILLDKMLIDQKDAKLTYKLVAILSDNDHGLAFDVFKTFLSFYPGEIDQVSQSFFASLASKEVALTDASNYLGILVENAAVDDRRTTALVSGFLASYPHAQDAVLQAVSMNKPQFIDSAVEAVLQYEATASGKD